MITVNSLPELENLLSKYNQGYLFRGQTKNYLKNGSTSIVSSFSRLGCHPPSMQKWSHYCDETMYCMFGPDSGGRQLTFDESNALLQHYGWRSFFIDATTDTTVAAWFASHSYIGKRELVVTEDCYEEGVFCTINTGEYAESYEDGFLYVISKEILSKHDIESHDLYKLGFSDFVPRYVAQSGVMIGPCPVIPDVAVVEVIKVKKSILLDYSKEHAVESLFPDRVKDKIYNILLSTPYELSENDGPESSPLFFHRALDIPEYDFEFTKINSPNLAFYKGDFAIPVGDPVSDKVFRCPDSFLYHTNIDTPDDVGELLCCLSEGESLTVECKGLLRLPPFHDSPFYLKGVQLHRIDKKLVVVNGLTVKYQGTVFDYLQLDDGWHYEINNNDLIRKIHKNDCPCNYDRKHQLILTILKKANRALLEGRFSVSNGVSYLRD